MNTIILRIIAPNCPHQIKAIGVKTGVTCIWDRDIRAYRMAEISLANKIIAKAAAQAFGGQAEIIQYWDNDHKSSVDVLACPDQPQRGVTSFSTIGVSDHPLLDRGIEYPVRAEFVGACGSGFQGFDNALASAAFCVINSQWFCYPGAIFPEVLAPYNCSPTMRHFLFDTPFLWEGRLCTMDLVGKKVAWLLAVPISEQERLFAIANGVDRLQKLLEGSQVDVLNLHRPSVA